MVAAPLVHATLNLQFILKSTSTVAMLQPGSRDSDGIGLSGHTANLRPELHRFGSKTNVCTAQVVANSVQLGMRCRLMSVHFGTQMLA